MQLAFGLLIFVACFAIIPRHLKRLGDVAPALIKAVVVLAAIGWILGALLQLGSSGAVWTAYGQ